MTQNIVTASTLVVCKRNYDKLCQISSYEDLTREYNFNSPKNISFTITRDGNEKCWDYLVDRRIIWIVEEDLYFEASVNIDENDTSRKIVTAISICEAELSQTYIYGVEINTETDIERKDYVPTVLYNKANPKASLINRVLYKNPNYTIEHVDNSIASIQRTFSFDGNDVISAFNEISSEIGCVFIYNSATRGISVYDLQTVCSCGHRGDFTDVCPKCNGSELRYGYGTDTAILIDRENIADSISVETNSDEFKNYFKVIGGDEVITNAIAACNPTGSNYFYMFSESDHSNMSSELSKKIKEYNGRLETKNAEYASVMERIYDCIDQLNYLNHSKMPSIELDTHPTAEGELAKLTESAFGCVAVTDVSDVSIYTANNAVVAYAKCLINSSAFSVEVADSILDGQTWTGKLRVENRYDLNDEDDYSDIAEHISPISIELTDDVLLYTEQRVKKTLDRTDVYLVNLLSLDEEETGPITIERFSEELTKYSLERLVSFEAAYQTIIDVLVEMNMSDPDAYPNDDNEDGYPDFYHDKYLFYYDRLLAIQSAITDIGNEIDAKQSEYDELVKQQKLIQVELDIEKFLGEDLYNELCSHRRETTYENSNYISDDLKTNSDILKKAKDLLEVAKNEAVKASTVQYTISATLKNLLKMKEFSPLKTYFKLGNWIRLRADEKFYRLRLIRYSYSESAPDSIDVEFSQATLTSLGMSDVNNLMTKLGSVATTYNAVKRQAHQGAYASSIANNWVENGFDLTASKIVGDANNQNVTWDKHGLLLRRYNDFYDSYDDRQAKIINNGIYITDDDWKTTRSAVGEFWYVNPKTKERIKSYGVIADTIVGNLILSKEIGVYNSDASIELTDGLTITAGRNNYDHLFVVQKEEQDEDGNITTKRQMYVDNAGNLILEGALIDANGVYLSDGSKKQGIESYINAVVADISHLEADSAIITTLESMLIKAEKIDAAFAEIDYLDSEFANIKNLVSNTISTTEINASKITGTEAQFDSLISNSAKFNTIDTDLAKIQQAIVGASATDTGIVFNFTAENAVVNEQFVMEQIANKITVGDLKAGNITVSDAMKIVSENGNLCISGNTMQFKGTGSDGREYIGIQIGYDTEDKPSIIIRDEKGASIITSSGITENAIADGLIKNSMIKNGTIAKAKLGFEIIEPNEHGGIDVTQIYNGDGGKFGVEYESFKQTVTEEFDGMNKTISDSIQYKLEIISTHGLVFKNSNVSTTLTPVVYKSNVDVTDMYNGSNFMWTRTSSNSASDEKWNAAHKNLKDITLTKADVIGNSTTFRCDLIVDDVVVASA